ncbi:hypothetical protein PCE1_004446 [Barthelona sp. PCE]
MFGADTITRIGNSGSNMYNFCVVSHVDSGKSTMVDALLSLNRLVSEELVGVARGMDTRPDEQRRCITMKSSSTVLLIKNPLKNNVACVNVMDTPGHFDFWAEVDAALGLVDGCFILIDVIEGIRNRTVSVIERAFKHRLFPVLVLNKIDKLLTISKMDESEIAEHLEGLITTVNSITAGFAAEEFFSKSEEIDIDKMDRHPFIFDPRRGNVIFASALNNWGFTLPQMAEVLSEKLKMPAQKILKNLWGHRYFNGKSFVGTPPSSRSKRFVSMCIFKYICQIFQAEREDFQDKLHSIAESLGLRLGEGTLDSKAILSKWLPMKKPLVECLFKFFPTAAVAQKYKLNIFGVQTPEVSHAMVTCHNDGPVLGFISKILLPYVDTDSGQPLGIGRLFSGTLRRGSKVRAIVNGESRVVTVSTVFLLMPRMNVRIEEVTAGNLFAISYDGMDTYTTLIDMEIESNDFFFNPSHSKALLTFKVDPSVPSQLPRLRQTLMKLDRMDSAMDFSISKKGEFLVSAVGPVHLEVIKKFVEKSRCDTQWSVPIVPMRETTISVRHRGIVESPLLYFDVQLGTLSDDVVDRVMEHQDDVKAGDYEFLHGLPFYDNVVSDKVLCFGPDHGCNVLLWSLPQQFRDSEFFNLISESLRKILIQSFQNATAVGPICGEKMHGIFIRITRIELAEFAKHEEIVASLKEQIQQSNEDEDEELVARLAEVTANYDREQNEKEVISHFHRGAVHSIITPIKMGFHEVFMGSGVRIVEPVYTIEAEFSSAWISKVTNWLQQKRGNVTQLNVRTGSDTYILSAELPVYESFNAQESLMSATSGFASFSIVGLIWKMIDEDPYFVPKTENELEDYIEGEFDEIFVKKMINHIRLVKGLLVDSQLNVDGEKLTNIKK